MIETGPQYVDISVFQGSLNWQAYKKWASQWDGVSRVAIRSSYGTGYTDSSFEANRTGALDAGIDSIIYYHYAYPQFNTARDEADWQFKIVGSIRPHDLLMLDYEENRVQATAQWAYDWLLKQEQNYGKPPTIYASRSYIGQHLQDARLAYYPLILADWIYTSSERPPCPLPWLKYVSLQFTDKAIIPGVSGPVDCNIYLGMERSNKHMEQQFNQVWGYTPGAYLSGIGKIVRAGFLAKCYSACFTTTSEISTVDWSGNPILFQGLSNGCHVEYAEGKGTVYDYLNRPLYSGSA